MKTRWLRGLAGLLVIGGLLAACSTGCRQAGPKPNPGKTTPTTKTTTTKTSQISTTITESIPKTTTTTKFDPMGYTDYVDSWDWPWRKFNSIEGFIHWIENPNMKIEKSPFEPEKDIHGYDVYKISYFEALYLSHQQMFVTDRFYMLPDVPSDWKLSNIYMDSSEVGFTYLDDQKNQYHFSYVYTNKIKKSLIEDSSDTLFKRSIKAQEYYVSDFLSDLSPAEEKKGWMIKTFINGYLCKFIEDRYDPDKKDSATEGYERVLYSEDTDLTDVVSKIKFKRIDLPPLKN